MMVEILKVNVLNLTFPADVNFSYIGSIPDVMFDKVPSDNAIISIYKKISKIDPRHVPSELRVILDVG